MDTTRTKPAGWIRRLLTNSRFWILAAAITLSVNIAGFTQLEVPAGNLQTIRIEQTYGFISLFLLYLAILASPLTSVFPNLPGKNSYLHARRAIGVSACFFAALHGYITFFGQLEGFSGVKYLSHTYSLSILAATFAFGVLCIMAATSFDWVVARMSYHRWKLLHRLVYLACLGVLFHVILIGPHYDNGLTFLSMLTYLAAAFLVILEGLRIKSNFSSRKAVHHG
jgi:DMSO/TMAO reductase YedYZ heme-binding membrane subunit